MVVLMIIVATISAGLITVFNICTRERIAFNQEVKLKKSVLNVFGIAYEKDKIIELFNEAVKQKEIGGRTVYQYYEDGEISSLSFEISGPGFWGPITALVALEPDLILLQGIEILHQEETPGLGGRISEDEFTSQFKGKATEPKISIDGITGATMTSGAFAKIINESVKAFKLEYNGH